MIADQVVEEAKRELAAGASQRAVARRLGIARTTVGCIARGTRPDYEALRAVRLARQRAAATRSEPVIRCPGCGAKTRGSCIACRTRAELKAIGLEVRAARRRGERERAQRLTLNLKPGEQERYEAARAAKMAEGDGQRVNGEDEDWPEAVCESDEQELFGFSGRVRPIVERIRFICPCGQLLRGVLILRPGKPQIVRFQARRPTTYEAWVNVARCPRCQNDFTKITAEQFRNEVMASSLPTGDGRANHRAQSGEAAP
jgi:transcriptional regulator with XRE-family HTH domain